MNFALNLAQNRVPGVKVDASRLPASPVEIARRLMSADVSPQTRASIENALKEQQAKNPQQQTPALLAGLVVGSPDFHRREHWRPPLCAWPVRGTIPSPP